MFALERDCLPKNQTLSSIIIMAIETFVLLCFVCCYKSISSSLVIRNQTKSRVYAYHKNFNDNFFSLFFLVMAQDVLQVYRMQHGTQHENIQGLQQKPVL